MATYQFISFEQRGQIGVLTLNNPERLNALSATMRDEVAEVLKAVRADDGDRKSVV